MKTLTVFFFVIQINVLSGQTHKVECCDPTIEWTEVLFWLDGAWSTRYTYDSIPVIFNGKSYFEILSSSDPNGGNWAHTYNYIRYEGSKVYYGWEEDEVVLIDFDLNVNDTFTLPWGWPIVVTSIDSITLQNGDKRKRLELHCDSWGSIPVYWIEGIGSSVGIPGEVTCGFDVGSALLCLWQNDTLLYQNPLYNTCWLNIVATTDLEKNNISFSPNPVYDQLNIYDPDQKIVRVVVQDLLGHIVYIGNDRNIEMEHLDSGSYSVSAILKKGQQITTMIIKQ